MSTIENKPTKTRSDLLQRSITAFLFVAVMLGGVLGGPIPFVVIFGIAAALSLWEFASIIFIKGDLRHKLATLFVGMISYSFLAFYHLNDIETSITAILFSILLTVFSLFISELYARSELPFQNVGIILLGGAYIGVPFLVLNLIAFESGTYEYRTVLALMFFTWSNDTGAFLLGRKIGKTPLMPNISPKKTWEGILGGLLLTLVVATAVSQIFDNLILIDWLILGFIVVVFGSYGDLIESMLKRSYQMKDSSNFLPGHGGILDRFDSFMYMLPFAATYLMWIK
ncbi:MAG: phosphatidate cytidylyltransferase [Bacteroidota bacterium]